MNQGPPFLSADLCRKLLSPQDILRAVEQALVWEAEGTVRWPTPRSLNLVPDGFGNHYHLKACVLDTVPVAGIRVVAHQADEASGSSTRWILLIDPRTCRPLAVIDESWNYLQRTGATAALATRWLATPDAAVLALVGAGRLASASLAYYARLFPLREIRIVSRRPQTRAALAEQARARFAVPTVPTDTIEQAVRGADLILTSTGAGRPLLEETWVSRGAVVVALETVEPGADFAKAADLLVVDSREQLEHELVEAFGNDAPGWVDATLGQIASGLHPGRSSPEQRVLVITQGLASQDVALAYQVHQTAFRMGSQA